ncbi:DedA family protein [Candidatus Nomurabacteria bacterium]|nr:DedA family protein [Candidatus Nomurabacteria bacterium]
MEIFLHNLLAWIDSSKYILLFLGMIVEGPLIMLTSGFLYKLGQFSFLPMYLVLVFGDFTADMIWYCIGRFGTRSTIFKYGHYVGITPDKLEKIERGFHKYHQKILIINKLTMGFGFSIVTLVVAGMFKVPYKNYIILNLIGGFIWTLILVTLGYFLGNIFSVVPTSMKVVSVVTMFTIFTLGIKYINNYLKTKEI